MKCEKSLYEDCERKDMPLLTSLPTKQVSLAKPTSTVKKDKEAFKHVVCV